MIMREPPKTDKKNVLTLKPSKKVFDLEFGRMIMYPDATAEVSIYLNSELKGGMYRDAKGNWQIEFLGIATNTLAEAELEIRDHFLGVSD